LELGLIEVCKARTCPLVRGRSLNPDDGEVGRIKTFSQTSKSYRKKFLHYKAEKKKLQRPLQPPLWGILVRNSRYRGGRRVSPFAGSGGGETVRKLEKEKSTLRRGQEEPLKN